MWHIRCGPIWQVAFGFGSQTFERQRLELQSTKTVLLRDWDRHPSTRISVKGEHDFEREEGVETWQDIELREKRAVRDLNLALHEWSSDSLPIWFTFLPPLGGRPRNFLLAWLNGIAKRIPPEHPVITSCWEILRIRFSSASVSPQELRFPPHPST